MLVTKKKHDISQHGDFENIECGVKDLSIVFDIISSKLYSNPLRTMIQEYISNARDSHVEDNVPHKPIEISLPTLFDKNIYIIDRGVGISPSRMREVFVNAGESTKNKGNAELGGFGVGSKVAWAYNDSFNIETNFDGTKYTYLCFINEKGIGNVTKLNEVPTTDENGTTISVEIASDDIFKSNLYTKILTEFWDTKPIINNLNNVLNDDNERIAYKNGDFFIIKRQGRYDDSFFNEFSNKGNITILIDGIPYTINYSKFNIVDGYHLFIKAQIGEIDIAINRESIRNHEDWVDEKLLAFNEIISNELNFNNNYEDLEDFLNNFSIKNNEDQKIELINFVDYCIIELLNGTSIKLRSYNNVASLIFDSYNFKIIQYYVESNKVKRSRYSNYGTSIKLENLKNTNLFFNDKNLKNSINNNLRNFVKTNAYDTFYTISLTIEGQQDQANYDFFEKNNVQFISKLNKVKNNFKLKFLAGRHRTDSYYENINDDVDKYIYIDNVHVNKSLYNYMNGIIINYNNLFFTNHSICIIIKKDKKKILGDDRFINYEDFLDELIMNNYKTLCLSDISAITDNFYFRSFKWAMNNKSINDIDDNDFEKLHQLNNKKNYLKPKNEFIEIFKLMKSINIFNIKYRDTFLDQKTRCQRWSQRKYDKMKKLNEYLEEKYPLVSGNGVHHVEDAIKYINAKFKGLL